MTKRPPLTHEVLIWDEHFFYGDENNCQQEALTCEWLIENGLMPDPTETENHSVLHSDKKRLDFVRGISWTWLCEEKTQ